MPKYNPALLRQSEMNKVPEGSGMVKSEEEIKRAMQLWPEETKNIESMLKEGQLLVDKAAISRFKDNPNNHWHRIEGEQWEEFVGSIRQFGVLTPLIVRPMGEDFEILAGHNRKYGAMEAGLTELPYVLMDVDDVEASVILGVTNNQREDTTDLEWGWAYRNTYEALKKAVGRPKTDALRGENGVPVENVVTVTTFSQEPAKAVRTLDIVAEKYGVGGKTIQRKMRLTYLMENLHERLVKDGYSQKIMVDLSYLTRKEQAHVLSAISLDSIKITEEIARELRDRAKESELTVDEVYQICKAKGEVVEKPKRPRKYSVDDALFPPAVKKAERENYIVKALQYIREHEIDLGE